MDEIFPPPIPEDGEAIVEEIPKPDETKSDESNITSDPEIITTEIAIDAAKPTSDEADVALDEPAAVVVEVPPVSENVPVIVDSSTTAIAAETITTAEPAAETIPTIAIPPAASAAPAIKAEAVIVPAPSTSSSRQAQHQEQLQQHLNMAQDWDASDIEKKLAENATMLSQWSLMLDKNGEDARNYFALILLSDSLFFTAITCLSNHE